MSCSSIGNVHTTGGNAGVVVGKSVGAAKWRGKKDVSIPIGKICKGSPGVF